jgi:hypothetical protein
MTSYKLSESQIAITVVPRSVRWPEPNAAAVWVLAHCCVSALRDVVRSADAACLEAEQDSECSASAIARRRAEICDQALRKLANFAAFEAAEKALIANIEALERLNYRDPEQVQTLEKLKRALTDLREGISATQRMLEERCKARKRVFA